MTLMVPAYKIIVVMPARNAEKTLEKTVEDILPNLIDEIILVDDNSQDNTAVLARNLGLTVFNHHQNQGYGANQKTCYREALKRKADIVVMLHPDYQYDPRILPIIIEPIKMGICDVMLGNRIRSRREALAGGMPLYKYISNRFLTIIENVFLGVNLGEFHSGLRAYNREVLETIPFENNSNDFVFDSEFLIQAVYFDFKIGDVPVSVRYLPDSSSINLKKSIIYGTKTLLTLVKFYFHKYRIIKSKLFIKQCHDDS